MIQHQLKKKLDIYYTYKFERIQSSFIYIYIRTSGNVISIQPQMLSREEEAELDQSNKKVKDINHTEFNGRSRASSPSLGNQAMSPNTKPSFKDKLVGEILGAFAQAFDLTDQMKEDLDSNDESGKASNSVCEGQVKIKLSKETKKCI